MVTALLGGVHGVHGTAVADQRTGQKHRLQVERELRIARRDSYVRAF